MKLKKSFPFTAIVAQNEFKLCLLLNIIDPTIGGVIATGDKGTGKTTTVRALSQLMGADFPFVNLPIGATEDRVLGSVNLEALINQKKTIIDKGLLAKAHNGFLYIDEVNLLNDYLMDVLLDASASGGYYLEREGISEYLESRFCLVGTMNPEEGDLRPQLLDRFGLSVSITTCKEIEIRRKIAIQRLTFDTNALAFYTKYQAEEITLKETILKAKENLATVRITEKVQETAVELTIKNKVEGMRADILLLKTARAYAAYLQEKEVTVEMLHTIAPFVLQHRAKDYQPPQNNNSDSEETNKNESEQKEQENSDSGNTSFQLPENVQKSLQFSVNNTSKKKEITLNTSALQLTPYSAKPQDSLALVKTIKNYMYTQKFKAIYKQATSKTTAKIVFLLDTSASMAVAKQLAYIKGLIQKTVAKYPYKKIEYAMVTLENASAKIIQNFTAKTEVLLQTNYQLKAGGKTNLGAAFFKVYELLKSVNTATVQLFVFTDGKANTGGENPLEYAVTNYKKYLGKLQGTTIVDTEQDFVKLGRAQKLAQNLGVSYKTFASL